MSDRIDRAYFERRAREERVLAAAAAEPCAAIIHAELARCYDVRVAGLASVEDDGRKIARHLSPATGERLSVPPWPLR